MKIALIILGIFASLIFLSTGQDYDYCHAFENDPYLLMSTKTAYQFIYGREKIQSVSNCTPIQIWILARHGTRYPGKKLIDRLPKLLSLKNQIISENQSNTRLCKPDFENLRNWIPNQNLNKSMVNKLTPQGEQDLRLLAKRLQSKFPEILKPNDPSNINSNNYKFRSTKTERTKSSSEAFMDGLFYSKNAVPIEIVPDNDTLLHAYKNCPAWDDSLINDRVNAEAEKFILSFDYQNLVQNVSRRLGFKNKLDNDSIQLMYDMCRYEKAWEINRLSSWCAVFSKDEFKILEYLEDLGYYYYTGPGRDINSKLSCFLLKNLFNNFRNLEQAEIAKQPKGLFYFGHSTTVQTLLDIFDIGKNEIPLLASNYHSMDNRKFRTSIHSPFAANLVAVFYRCSKLNLSNKVMFYLNESPVLLKGCNAGLCDWNYLKARYGRQAEECTLDFCHASGV